MSRLIDSSHREQGLQDRLVRDAVRFLDGYSDSTLGEVTSAPDRTGARVFAPARTRQGLNFVTEEALATAE